MGSEMCIRDRVWVVKTSHPTRKLVLTFCLRLRIGLMMSRVSCNRAQTVDVDTHQFGSALPAFIVRQVEDYRCFARTAEPGIVENFVLQLTWRPPRITQGHQRAFRSAALGYRGDYLA